MTVSTNPKVTGVPAPGSPRTLYVATDTYANLIAAGYNGAAYAGMRFRATDGTGFDCISDGSYLIPVTSGRVNVQSGTTYTLTPADNNTILRFTSGSAIALTCNSGQAITGFNCLVEVAGAGQITFSGTATIVNILGATKTSGQYGKANLTCSVAGTFNLSGDVI